MSSPPRSPSRGPIPLGNKTFYSRPTVWTRVYSSKSGTKGSFGTKPWDTTGFHFTKSPTQTNRKEPVSGCRWMQSRSWKTEWWSGPEIPLAITFSSTAASNCLTTLKTWTPAGCSVSWRHTTTCWTKRCRRCETAEGGASNNSSFTLVCRRTAITQARSTTRWSSITRPTGRPRST
ncbi:uncharacterized protein LOC124311456 [Daphnia pulicaria]|uniref:uncharacterized protein LOC124311456 n=1 Tax=Daphnia pulicaria TaxID=35523 RepID=UPI001EEA48F5|nr:uncharacterized protein LOC124311456 [Daphnia pulicaria]